MIRYLLLILTLTASACATIPETSSTSLPIHQSDPRGTIPQAMGRYAASHECEGKDFEDATGLIEDSLGNTESLGNSGNLNFLELSGKFRKMAARDMIQLADEAAQKACVSTAKKLYLNVIDTFTGSDYAAFRQRAQIGIDDLRAGSSQIRKGSEKLRHQL